MTKTITPKQELILKYLYQYKFLNRIQIQALLNHKYHKRINDWLKDLTQKEYVNRIYSNKFGENTKPAIYYLALNGIRFLKTQDDYPLEVLRTFYRLKDRSNDFIDKSLLIGKIVLDLEVATNLSRGNGEEHELTYLIATTTDLANSEYRFHFLTEYKTDLLIKRLKKKKTSKRTVSNFFLFTVLAPTLPKYSIRKRIRDFIELYNGYEWDEVEKTFPTIMVICPTLATLIYTKRLTRNLWKDEDEPKDLHFQFTTIEKIKEHGVTGEIWEVTC
jgi:hypothetical protein